MPVDVRAALPVPRREPFEVSASSICKARARDSVAADLSANLSRWTL